MARDKREVKEQTTGIACHSYFIKHDAWPIRYIKFPPKIMQTCASRHCMVKREGAYQESRVGLLEGIVPLSAKALLLPTCLCAAHETKPLEKSMELLKGCQSEILCPKHNPLPKQRMHLLCQESAPKEMGKSGKHRMLVRSHPRQCITLPLRCSIQRRTWETPPP